MEAVQRLIRDVPDFPKPGILFKDITPVLADAAALKRVVDRLASCFSGQAVDKVAATESRGFMFGMPLALELGAGFVPIRKPGKLPYETHAIAYSLEYGEGHLEVHADAFAPGERVVWVDDLLATGGTAKASCELIERQGARVVGVGFVIELAFLAGRKLLEGREIHSLLTL